MLETLILSAVVSLSGLIGVAPGTLPVAALKADAKNPVIVHIVSRDQTLTVKAGERGLLYSLTSKEGKIIIADASAEKFAQLQPQMYRAVRQYIAVHADTSSAVSASAAPEVTATVDAR